MPMVPLVVRRGEGEVMRTRYLLMKERKGPKRMSSATAWSTLLAPIMLERDADLGER